MIKTKITPEGKYYDTRTHEPVYNDDYLVKTEFGVYHLAHFASSKWVYLGDSPGGEVAFFTNIPQTNETWERCT